MTHYIQGHTRQISVSFDIDIEKEVGKLKYCTAFSTLRHFCAVEELSKLQLRKSMLEKALTCSPAASSTIPSPQYPLIIVRTISESPLTMQNRQDLPELAICSAAGIIGAIFAARVALLSLSGQRSALFQGNREDTHSLIPFPHTGAARQVSTRTWKKAPLVKSLRNVFAYEKCRAKNS